MKDQLSETISAVMDSQADDLEVRRLLKALDNASEEEAAAILAQWESFHSIGSVLRNESRSNNETPTMRASSNFAASVSAAIADEAPMDKVARRPSKSDPMWQRFAVAASVTLAILVGVQEYESMQAGDASYTADNAVTVPALKSVDQSVDQGVVDLTAVQLASSEVALESSMSEAEKLEAIEAQERLNEYLLEHTNHAAKQSGQGMIPFARLANFEDE
jgi:sigma-E factor negative regulatory protein RseA